MSVSSGSAVSGASDIPIVDLTPYREKDLGGTAALAASIDAANRDTGFLIVVGHGVPAELIQEMDAITRAFFELPEAEKLLIRSVEPAQSRGYMPPRSRALAKGLGQSSPRDLVEYFSAGTPDVPQDAYHAPENAGVNFRPNVWPAAPVGMANVWTQYYRRVEALATDLIRTFALALDLDEFWFDGFVDRHCSNLFANYYPAVTVPPEPGQLRLGAHTDYGSLTLLYQDETPGGLQINRDGVWSDAPHVPGAFVVNIGDLMQRWTNDRWVSTLHRVQNPVGARLGVPRLSIPFFHQPNYDALITAIPTCLSAEHPEKYEPITSGANMYDKTATTLAAG